MYPIVVLVGGVMTPKSNRQQVRYNKSVSMLFKVNIKKLFVSMVLPINSFFFLKIGRKSTFSPNFLQVWVHLIHLGGLMTPIKYLTNNKFNSL